MKKVLYFLLAVVSCAMLFASCEKESDLLASKVKVSPSEISFDGQSPKKVSVTVESDGDWLATAPEWVSVTPNHGTGNATVEVLAEPNLDADGALSGPRSGEIVFQGGEVTAKVKVTQAGDDAKDQRRTYVKVAEAKGGKAYLIVAAGNAASPLEESKTYGYLPAVPVEPVDDKIEMADNSKGFIFTAVEGGFTIQDVTGRYYYQTGSYNSFNVDVQMPAEGAVWTVEPQEDGTVKIINASVNKYFQIDTGYGSYGSYDSGSETRFLPVLYEDTKDPEIVTPEPPTPPTPTDGPVEMTIAEAMAQTDSALVSGTVMATCARGFVLEDETGTTLVYSSSYAQGYVAGDQVTVGGKPGAYNYGGQIAPNEEYYQKTGTVEVTYPDPVVFNAEKIAEYKTLIEGKSSSDPVIFPVYVKMTGVVSAGDFNNLIIDGVEIEQGSFYQLTAEQKETVTALNGKKVDLYGYFQSISGGKFYNVIMTSIEEVTGGEPELKPSIYGVVGTHNNWGNDGVLDNVMYEVNGMYVAYAVEFADEANSFKFRANNEWNDEANYGPAAATYMQNDSWCALTVGSGAQNMNIAAGTYDIWFDLENMKAYAMTPGTAVEDAVETWPEEVDPSTPATGTWYLVGSFNSWTPGDENYLMSNEGSWYVYRNFVAADGCQVKLCDGTWNDNRGGDFTAVNEPIAVNLGGNNIYPAAGTYDVYMNGAKTEVYFMTPGTLPGAPVAEVWGIAGGFNGWDAAATVCEEEGEWWVARNLALDADGFKFLKNRAWSVNLTADATIVPNVEFAVADGDGKGNTYVDPVGTYDVYLAKTLDKAYVMTPGLKPGEKPVPVFEAGDYYIAANVSGAYKLATPVTSSYGYLNVEDALAGAEIAGYKDHVFTFTAVDGGFTIQDANGKYYYQTGSYNNFNVSASMPADGAVWTVAENEDGTFTVTNTSVNKYIQYSAGYNSFGSYASLQDGGVLPVLAPAGNAIERPQQEIPEEYVTDVEVNTVSSAYTDGLATVNGISGVATLKFGTSKLYGEATLTLPAGTTKIAFYAVGWKGTSASLEFSIGETILGTQALAANDGATSNAPYTMTVTASDFYTFSLPEQLTEETVVTVKTTGAYRAIMFGIKAIVEEIVEPGPVPAGWDGPKTYSKSGMIAYENFNPYMTGGAVSVFMDKDVDGSAKVGYATVYATINGNAIINECQPYVYDESASTLTVQNITHGYPTGPIAYDIPFTVAADKSFIEFHYSYQGSGSMYSPIGTFGYNYIMITGHQLMGE